MSVQRVGALVREHGWSRGAVSDEFNLSLDGISAALDYYDAHPKEMDDIGAQRDKTYERLRYLSRA